jgi:hypothetical protein
MSLAQKVRIIFSYHLLKTVSDVRTWLSLKVVISATDLLKTMMLVQRLDTDKKKEVYVTMVLC